MVSEKASACPSGTVAEVKAVNEWMNELKEYEKSSW